jgi:D-3-phosphoglycerate dehydrogenase
MYMAKRGELAIVGTRYQDLALEEAVLAGHGVALRRVDEGEGAKLVAELRGVDVVLLGSRVYLDASVLASLPELRGIVRYGIGLDNVDVVAAKARGVVLAYVPDYCVEEVATHTVALLLAAWRKLLPATEWVRQGGWGIGPLRPLRRVSGQTVGLVGFGRIGQAVAERLRPFGCRILAHDPLLPRDVIAARGVHPVSLEELFQLADAISLHLPLTPTTRHVIGARALAQMKEGVVLVNTSRGGLIDQGALVAAVRAGKVSAVGCDVFEEEPPPADEPLLGLREAIVTPHAAWYTEEAERELRHKGLAEALRILRGEEVQHPV